MTLAARLALALLLALWAGPAAAACRDDAVELRGDWGTARIAVEVADTPRTQARGLMHRERLAAMAGMLFVYDRPQRVSFWMRNTLIPLDMIFADPAGRITRIHENAIPHDETPIPGGEGVQYVLEVNGGLARRLGLAEGDAMRHPRIDPARAAWPCD